MNISGEEYTFEVMCLWKDTVKYAKIEGKDRHDVSAKFLSRFKNEKPKILRIVRKVNNANET